MTVLAFHVRFQGMNQTPAQSFAGRPKGEPGIHLSNMPGGDFRIQIGP